MSWSFSYSAADKAEAQDVLDKKLEEQAGHFPKAVKSMVSRAIDALPDCDDSIINVSTYGHFNQGDYRGTSNLSITVSNQFRPTE